MLAYRYLLSFHDPELSAHLFTIGLGPELYVLPWFMTFYAHIFPFDKLYPLWDHFLTGPPFLLLFTAVAILSQLRDQILQWDFGQVYIM